MSCGECEALRLEVRRLRQEVEGMTKARDTAWAELREIGELLHVDPNDADDGPEPRIARLKAAALPPGHVAVSRELLERAIGGSSSARILAVAHLHAKTEAAMVELESKLRALLEGK